MRRENDFYETSQELTRALLDTGFIHGRVMELCAGLGAISDVLQESDRITEILENDINTNLIDLDFYSDAAIFDSCCYDEVVDWYVTNPPYNQADKILRNAFFYARVGVAMLLRLSIQEPTKGRSKVLARCADHLKWQGVFSQPRPSFRKGEINPKTGKPYGTDSVTTAWFVWDKRWSWWEKGIKCPFGYLTGWREND